MPSSRALCVFCLISLFCGLVTTEARADVSSWLYTGGGVLNSERDSQTKTRGLFALETGLGTSPVHPIVVGGLFRLPIAFGGGGADLSLALRTATRGYALGDFGVALDLGAYQRYWGQDTSGGLANVSLGGPFGLTLNLGASLGTHDTRDMWGSFGIDFARLTVHRESSQNWWPNHRLPLSE